jgi:hypothetical protein
MGLWSSGIAIGFSKGALGTLVCDSSEQDLNAGRGVLSMLTEVTVYSDGTSQSLSYWVTFFRSMLKAQDHVP